MLCAAKALRDRGISFISVGIGTETAVNVPYLKAISTDYFRVSKRLARSNDRHMIGLGNLLRKLRVPCLAGC